MKGSMGGRVLLGVTALVLAGAAYWLVAERHDADAAARGTDGRASEPSASALAAQPAARASVREKAGAKPLRERQLPLAQLFQEDTRLIALSPGEHAWLKRHYFIGPTEMARAADLPGEVLQNAISDPWLQTILGKRLMDRGKYVPAATVLERAASRGAIYAYEEAAIAQLKDSMATFGEIDANAVNVFRARIEVAKILGDHRAEALLDVHLPEAKRRYDARTVQLQTTEFLRQLGSGAQLMGIAAPGPDPRPNAGLWADLQQLSTSPEGRAEFVPVYGD